MKLFVPPLGTRLRLTKTWNFRLHCEERNRTLWNLRSVIPMERIPYAVRRSNFSDICLHEMDELIIDRIFIRKGSDMYNSVTFRALVKDTGLFHAVRFWVELKDANNIECEVI